MYSELSSVTLFITNIIHGNFKNDIYRSKMLPFLEQIQAKLYIILRQIKNRTNSDKIIVWYNILKQKSIFSRNGPHSLLQACPLSGGGRYKFSSPKLREAQVQSLKIQTGRLFLCTKSYTSPNVFSPSPYVWHSKGLIHSISSRNKLHLSKHPEEGRGSAIRGQQTLFSVQCKTLQWERH